MARRPADQHAERIETEPRTAERSTDPIPEQRQPYAYPGYGYGYGAPPTYPAAPPPAASAASAVTFLAGVWLVLSPFALDYAPAVQGVGAYWNDLVVGSAIAVLALVRAVSPRNVPWFSVVNVALGTWLIVAPMVLDYAEGVSTTVATSNDVIVGALVVIMAGLSAAITYRNRSDRNASDR
ncbi:SPW repeat protein [Lentzea sp. NEAU-D7]|uniref:SPW repeat protein n=1 Tax=Lentzea sp. NEAU-D7 TaxID=2994667 RepID=UPI00224AEA62|nr:SPW repeat protein [Lentzea sp. NEAU-D7]MCX2948890.1 SPW repeat protein [Lentzea sp. NEAU-D7]